MEKQPKANTHFSLHLPATYKLANESLLSISQEVASWLFHMDGVQMDEETVHDIRVAIRQLKSLMYFYKPLLRKESYQKSQELLSEAMDTFEATRENDVLILALDDFCKKMQETSTKNLDKRKASLELWKERFAESNKSALSTPDRNKSALSWIPLLEAWILLIRQDPFKSKRTGTTTKRFSKKRIRMLMLNWLSKYHAKDTNDQNALHKSRIAGKKIRYMLRAMDGTFVKESSNVLKLLANYQDLAGDLHDIHRFKTMMDQPVSLDMALFRKEFFTYQNKRADRLVYLIPETRKRLEKEIIEWINVNGKDS